MALEFEQTVLGDEWVSPEDEWTSSPEDERTAPDERVAPGVDDEWEYLGIDAADDKDGRTVRPSCPSSPCADACGLPSSTGSASPSNTR